jgi:hypothetical protein
MNKVFVVYGDDGFDGHGATVFGMYQTEAAARERVSRLEDLYAQGEDGCKYLGYSMVEVAAGGSDFRLQIGG